MGDNVKRWKEDFPALKQDVNGHPLIYLDNAATTQKPTVVIDAIAGYYRGDNANVHRGIHELSRRATLGYEGARERAGRFFGAEESGCVIFTRGVTEAVNLIAQGWGRKQCGPGDVILLTELEHHSNLVPWQMLCSATGARLEFIPVKEDGVLELESLGAMLHERVKLLAMTHISNTLGTVNPVETMCRAARERGIATLVDGAQSGGHRPVSVEEIGCDFYCFSGHKMAGPMGIGGLVVRRAVLEELPPWQGGGEMISRVDWHTSEWNTAPHRYEAGTPHVEGAYGLHAAMDYLDGIGRERIAAHDAELAALAFRRLKALDGVRVFGPDPSGGQEHAGAVSFVMEAVHAHDVVTLADQLGLALRGGHHCNQPLMKKLGVPATVRASFYLYNTHEDVERLIEGMEEIVTYFRR